jgi:hypothetical protein
VYASEAKKLEFLVHLDHFSKYLKYLRFRVKFDHIADSLLKDAVLTVGVNLRLCLLSLWNCLYFILIINILYFHLLSFT